ncbi:MAG: hypothetical protein ABR520_06405 [Mycobacteriales bacterium]|nr:hypothetical protein [Frankia sp.]
MRLVRILVAAILIVAPLATHVAPAAATGTLGPPVVVWAEDPPHTGFDSAVDDRAVVHGFVGEDPCYPNPRECTGTARISYVESWRGRWRSEATPYVGSVLAVAVDRTGTYLLYRGSGGLRITKRTSSGAYTAGHLIDAAGAFFGDVMARDGRWWAVWSHAAGPEPSSQWDLYQAKTMGTATPTQRITNTPVTEYEVTITPRPGGGATLFWSRETTAPDNVDLWSAVSSDGAWQSRVFASDGGQNRSPDAYTAGTGTYVAWLRDRTTVEADYRGAWRTREIPGQPAGTATYIAAPHVHASNGRTFVAFVDQTQHCRLAERYLGAWRLGYAMDVNHECGLVDVTSWNGYATVLVDVRGDVYARSQA